MEQKTAHHVNVNDLNFEVLKKIRSYLRRMVDAGGSDLHVKANSVVRARINGEIIPLSGEILSKEDALTFAKELLRTRFPELVEKKSWIWFIHSMKIPVFVSIFFFRWTGYRRYSV